MTRKSPDTTQLTPQRLVLVTGPSGAGRLTAVKSLEDIGFEAIDNLPLSLWPRLLDGPALQRPLALGVDVRNRDFSVQGLLDELDRLSARPDVEVDLLYLDCSVDVLVRRFSETRRPHPLGDDAPTEEAVERERDLLLPVRTRADALIDTSDLTPHDLRAEIAARYAMPGDMRMAVSVQSFSYKRGIPRGVDMVLDVRFLRNPHWQPGLRELTGQDPAVADYVRGDARFEGFAARLRDLVLDLLPAFREEGKSNLTIAFGCTGGQHRSVAVAETLANALEEAGWRVSIRHRELERRARIRAAASKHDGVET